MGVKTRVGPKPEAEKALTRGSVQSSVLDLMNALAEENCTLVEIVIRDNIGPRRRPVKRLFGQVWVSEER